jgi:CRP-like cAMP-binding protein
VTELRDHPFLRTLHGDQLEALIRCAREVEYRAGSFVFREGGAADAVYLLRSGCVALEQHVPGRGVIRVESLCAGDLLGLSWLFGNARWTLDARCIEEVRAFALDASCVRAQMEQDDVLAVELLTHTVGALYQRLMRVRLQRLDVYRAEA